VASNIAAPAPRIPGHHRDGPWARPSRTPTPKAVAAAGSAHGRIGQTVTSSRISSKVTSPIPLTSSSWSTEVNGPCSSRY
jgi:hypothetical protein